MSSADFRTRLRTFGRGLLGPLVGLLARLGVHPNAVTLAALPLSVGAGVLFAFGHFPWAALVLAVVGLSDSLDGELSRRRGLVSAAGALLDSNVDRCSEFIILLGLAVWYFPRPLVLLCLALVYSSIAVSYVRARAEGLGATAAVGLFERPLRVVIMVIGALVLGAHWFHWALWLLLVGTVATALQRFFYARRRLIQGP